MEKTQEKQKIGEEPEDSTYNHIVKYTGFLGLIQVLTMLVSIIRNKLAAVMASAMKRLCAFSCSASLYA